MFFIIKVIHYYCGKFGKQELEGINKKIKAILNLTTQK